MARIDETRSVTTTVNLVKGIAPAMEVLLGTYSVLSLAQGDPRVREHQHS